MMADINDNTLERLGSVTITDKVSDGVAGTDAVYTDVWVSMGEKVPVEERDQAQALQGDAGRHEGDGRANSIFMHCLPAFHDLKPRWRGNIPELIEVDDAVSGGPQSRS
ncbi:MAG: hypothetical protein M9905_02765 [Rhizobiaceae bacterium]|nr:hypothetical protein [Rhizobiaceae bacterium]